MRYLTILVTLVYALLVSCSGGAQSPIAPSTSGGVSARLTSTEANRCLWGYYDVFIDIENQTAEAAVNRSAMFAANVVTFLNSKPASLTFHINGTPMGPDYVDVDIDVSITHPFPGMPQYNGYDVMGVFMGDGSASLNYDPALIYPVLGFDQLMLPDPVDGMGGPDGYTRWFNLPEFSTGGMAMFQYTQGKMASPGFAGTSTLNPYRCFADGLGTNDDLWTWLAANGTQHGQFSSGATNSRNYYLRFPNAKGVKYGYAVVANWKGDQPENHPANATEAVAVSVVDNSTVYYVSPSLNGGNIALDVSLFGWDFQPSAIYIESTVLSSSHQLTPSEMTPIGGGDNYSTYHVEVAADNVTGLEGNEFWVIAQYDGFGYTNDFGVTNLAGDAPLAAFFRYDLHILTTSPTLKVLSPNGGETWYVDSDHDITWESTGDIQNVKIEYSKDWFASDIHQIVASTENDGVYQWKVPNDPSKTVRVRIKDAASSASDTSDSNFTIAPVLDVVWADPVEMVTTGMFGDPELDEISPCVAQNSSGTLNAFWFGYSVTPGMGYYSDDKGANSSDGTTWSISTNIFGTVSSGAGLQRNDQAKIAPHKGGSCATLVGVFSGHYMTLIDARYGTSWPYLFAWTPEYTYNIEMMTDSSGYIFAVVDGGGVLNGRKTSAPNQASSGIPFVVNTGSDGRLSHVRSWGRDAGDILWLVHGKTSFDGIYLAHGDDNTNLTWTDGYVVWQGAGYDDIRDPSMHLVNEVIHLSFVRHNTSSGEYELCYTYGDTTNGFSDPVVIDSSSSPIEDAHLQLGHYANHDVLGTAYMREQAIWLSYSSDAGGTWQAPEAVQTLTEPAEDPDMIFISHNAGLTQDLIVIWVQGGGANNDCFTRMGHFVE